MNYRQAKKRAKKKGLPVPEKPFRGYIDYADMIYNLESMKADIVYFIRGDVIAVDENGEIIDSEEKRKEIEEATADIQTLINLIKLMKDQHNT